MERFQEARDKARKNLQVADHMISVTYKVVDDPKLLLAVMENVFLALTNSMASILYYERLFKRIPPFHDNFDSKFFMFKENCVPKFGIPPEQVRLIQEVKTIIAEHKESPVEFSRGDKFVICSENYDLRSLSEAKVKDYIERTKQFVQHCNSLVSVYEGIFK